MDPRRALGAVDPAGRFSDRVAHYVASRPDYPAQLVSALQSELGLAPNHVVADLGCGTGLLAERLLDAGCTVVGIEPNAGMRAAAATELGHREHFSVRDGRAEATGLDADSIDLAVAGQAFHWFHPEPTRTELLRILRGPAPVAMVWNRRRRSGTAFLEGYEALLQRFGTDYRIVSSTTAIDANITAFLGSPGRRYSFDNAQRLDRVGLRRRLLSCSYVPQEGHPERAPMLDAADQLFDTHARDGSVSMDYDTVVVTGRLRP